MISLYKSLKGRFLRVKVNLNFLKLRGAACRWRHPSAIAARGPRGRRPKEVLGFEA